MFGRLLVLGFCISTVVGLPVYHVGVCGAFFCGETPYEGAHVELFDYDVLRPDDKLAEVNSGVGGKFYVHGKREALVPLVPYVEISEKCTGELKCRKVWIPVDYQWLDGSPKKVYAMGRVNLTDGAESSC